MIRLAIEEIGQKKTIIIISHRLSFIEKMDRIFTIKNHLIEEISKDVLIKQGEKNSFINLR